MLGIDYCGFNCSIQWLNLWSSYWNWQNDCQWSQIQCVGKFFWGVTFCYWRDKVYIQRRWSFAPILSPKISRLVRAFWDYRLRDITWFKNFDMRHSSSCNCCFSIPSTRRQNPVLHGVLVGWFFRPFVMLKICDCFRTVVWGWGIAMISWACFYIKNLTGVADTDHYTSSDTAFHLTRCVGAVGMIDMLIVFLSCCRNSPTTWLQFCCFLQSLSLPLSWLRTALWKTVDFLTGILYHLAANIKCTAKCCWLVAYVLTFATWLTTDKFLFSKLSVAPVMQQI